MMTQFEQKQQHTEIDAAMQQHIATLHDAAFDAIVALLGILLGILSFIHAIVRVIFAIVGLVVWTLGVWLIALKALRQQCVSRSSTSPFRDELEVQKDE